MTHILRVARNDRELRGNRIRAGDRVVNWNISANRDEAAFTQPGYQETAVRDLSCSLFDFDFVTEISKALRKSDGCPL